MRGTFAKSYTVFAVLFFVGVAAYLVFGLNEARNRNEVEAARQLRNLTNQLERNITVSGRYSPRMVKQVIDSYRSRALKAFGAYAPDGRTDYLFSTSAAYLDHEPGSVTTSPRFVRDPLTEVRVIQSFTLPDGSSRLGEAVYTGLFKSDLYRLLRHALIATAAFALFTAAVTVVSLLAGRPRRYRAAHSELGAAGAPFAYAESDTKPAVAEPDYDGTADAAGSAGDARRRQESPTPRRPPTESPSEGLFSRETGLSFEQHLKTRLTLELERAAYNDQDLAVLLIRFPDIVHEDGSYARAAKVLGQRFTFEDLSFEYGNDGFCIILPNSDINQGIKAAEDFRNRTRRNAPELPHPTIGVTARSGRLVESSRVLSEAQSALKKAAREPGRIVGFRPDPGKYRSYIAHQSEE